LRRNRTDRLEYGEWILLAAPVVPGSGRDGQTPWCRERRAAREDIIVLAPDKAMVFGVQDGREEHAELHVIRKVMDAGDTFSVEGLSPLQFVPDRRADPLRELESFDVLERDAMALERFLREVDPIVFDDVLADVSEEIGQLERFAEGRRMGSGRRIELRIEDVQQEVRHGDRRPA
jgi:hypothetical protein